MDNFNDPFALQLSDSGSGRAKSATSKSQKPILEPAYSFLSSALSNVLSSVAVLLSDENPSRTAFLKMFIDQARKNKVPIIYKGRFEVEMDHTKITKTLQDMARRLKEHSQRVAFSTEAELISIFREVFDEALFASEVFCLASSIIYRAIKETALKPLSDLHYSLFIHFFLLENGKFFTDHRLQDGF